MKPENFVAIDVSKDYSYPRYPFNPPRIYPEFSKQLLRVNPKNEVYGKVRQVLIELGLDNKHIGSKKWNPFKELVKLGDKVVIKPNLVYDKHPLGKTGSAATLTHASLIRPIIDYILLAQSDIELTICDVPLQSTDWNKVCDLSGMSQLVRHYKSKGIRVSLLDLRRESSVLEEGVIIKRIVRDRDPLGYVSVNLGRKSDLMPIISQCKRLEITDYSSGTVWKHHNERKNEYCIPRTILDADLFINVPKLKTHRKAGITVALKNLIGINGDKRWIAHHRRGSSSCGGDEYPSISASNLVKLGTWNFLKSQKHFYCVAQKLRKLYGKIVIKEGNFESGHMKASSCISEGSWYGNDTLWRCIKDINKIIFYADKTGIMRRKKQRKYLCIVDGIIGMECEGPMHGIPKRCGIIVCGTNPVYIDKVCADLMGFDYRKIPMIREGFFNKSWSLTDSGRAETRTNLRAVPNLRFKSSSGWRGHIEK